MLDKSVLFISVGWVAKSHILTAISVIYKARSEEPQHAANLPCERSGRAEMLLG
jgi:hypothetical protein